MRVRRSVLVVLVAAGVVTVFLSTTLRPSRFVPVRKLPDWVLHGLPFSFLAGLADLSVAHRRQWRWVVGGAAVMTTIGFGLAIEALQGLIGRVFDPYDVAVNAAGAVLGGLVAAAFNPPIDRIAAHNG